MRAISERVLFCGSLLLFFKLATIFQLTWDSQFTLATAAADNSLFQFATGERRDISKLQYAPQDGGIPVESWLHPSFLPFKSALKPKKKRKPRNDSNNTSLQSSLAALLTPGASGNEKEPETEPEPEKEESEDNDGSATLDALSDELNSLLPDVDDGLPKNIEDLPHALGRDVSRGDDEQDKEPFTLKPGGSKGTIPGLNYLGTGYDLIFGNPIGDPVTMLDPGFKPPVVDLQWSDSPKGISNDLVTMHPLGGWVRDEVACRRAETMQDVSNVTDYRNSLSVDASVSASYGIMPISFSASSSFQKTARNLAAKNSKTFILKIYCTRYAAGLDPEPLAWHTRDSFFDAVIALPQFTGLKEDSACQPPVFRGNEDDEACKDSVRPWMDFFKVRGTHIVNTVQLGGKMTNQIDIKKSALKEMLSQGLDVSVEVQAFAASVSSSVSTKSASSEGNKKLGMKKVTTVLGGRPPKDVNDPAQLSDWSLTVEQLPMPVKISLTPFSALFEFAGKKDDYDAAFDYYGKAFGMSQQDLEALVGKPENLSKRLQKAVTIGYSGPPPGFAVCPKGKILLFGFALHTDPHIGKKGQTEYHMNICKAGSEKCDGVGSKRDKYDDSRIWAVCGEEELPFFSQQIAQKSGAPATATCPKGMRISFGFGLSTSGSNRGAGMIDIYPCRNGQRSCTKPGVRLQGRYTEKNYVWIACFNEDAMGSEDIASIASAEHRGKCRDNKDRSITIGCPSGASMLSGFAFQVHTRFSINSVRKSFTLCQDKRPGAKCTSVGSKACHRGTLFYEGNYEGFISFGICTTEEATSKETAGNTAVKKKNTAAKTG